MLEELGVRRIINCTGTVTVLGGTTVDPEVIDAMKEVSGIYVDMPTLHRKAGKYIAKLVGSEAAFVVNGAEAGLVIALAACMTGGKPEKMVRLPDVRGMKNEYLVQRLHRNMYDYALSLTGGKLVEVGGESKTTLDDLRKTINAKTAAVVYFAYDPQPGVLPLKEVCRIAHNRRVPVIVDAAAELPPVQNLTKFLRAGADLVIFSGGKDIGAPNDTGLILGRRTLIDACMMLGPHSYQKVGSQTRVFIGRPMKTSKEDVIAFVTALKRYLRTDHAKRLAEWRKQTEFIGRGLRKLGGRVLVREVVESARFRPAGIPRLEVEFRIKGIGAEGVVQELLQGEPPIAAYVTDGKLGISPQCLAKGEEKFVLERLLEIIPSRPKLSGN